MPQLLAQLRSFARQSTLWVGVGNPACPHDNAGLRLAELLDQSAIPHVVRAGPNPERWITSVDLASYQHVVFLDAVDLGANPGSVVLLSANDIAARYPQVSTHKISLGLLARYVESSSRARAWLLGIQSQVVAGRSSVVAGRSPFAVRRSPFAVRRSPFDVRRSPFDVRRSPFDVRRSPFDVRRSTFDVRRSTFDVRRSTFNIQLSLDLLHQLIADAFHPPRALHRASP
jgi:hydrogenase maturation protease